MTHPTEPPPGVQTADTTHAIEPAGSPRAAAEHLRPCRHPHRGSAVAHRISRARTVYVCPAVSATGLDGVL